MEFSEDIWSLVAEQLAQVDSLNTALLAVRNVATLGQVCQAAFAGSKAGWQALEVSCAVPCPLDIGWFGVSSKLDEYIAYDSGRMYNFGKKPIVRCLQSIADSCGLLRREIAPSKGNWDTLHATLRQLVPAGAQAEVPLELAIQVRASKLGTVNAMTAFTKYKLSEADLLSLPIKGMQGQHIRLYALSDVVSAAREKFVTVQQLQRAAKTTSTRESKKRRQCAEKEKVEAWQGRQSMITSTLQDLHALDFHELPQVLAYVRGDVDQQLAVAALEKACLQREAKRASLKAELASRGLHGFVFQRYRVVLKYLKDVKWLEEGASMAQHVLTYRDKINERRKTVQKRLAARGQVLDWGRGRLDNAQDLFWHIEFGYGKCEQYIPEGVPDEADGPFRVAAPPDAERKSREKALDVELTQQAVYWEVMVSAPEEVLAARQSFLDSGTGGSAAEVATAILASMEADPMRYSHTRFYGTEPPTPSDEAFPYLR